jgi:hypothetical protein
LGVTEDDYILEGIASSFEPGIEVCDWIRGSCVRTNDDGSVNVSVEGGEPRVYVRKADMCWSKDICIGFIYIVVSDNNFIEYQLIF